jgi:hypothetical protein
MLPRIAVPIPTAAPAGRRHFHLHCVLREIG